MSKEKSKGKRPTKSVSKSIINKLRLASRVENVEKRIDGAYKMLQDIIGKMNKSQEKEKVADQMIMDMAMSINAIHDILCGKSSIEIVNLRQDVNKHILIADVSGLYSAVTLVEKKMEIMRDFDSRRRAMLDKENNEKTVVFSHLYKVNGEKLSVSKKRVTKKHRLLSGVKKPKGYREQRLVRMQKIKSKRDMLVRRMGV